MQFKELVENGVTFDIYHKYNAPGLNVYYKNDNIHYESYCFGATGCTGGFDQVTPVETPKHQYSREKMYGERMIIHTPTEQLFKDVLKYLEYDETNSKENVHRFDERILNDKHKQIIIFPSIQISITDRVNPAFLKEYDEAIQYNRDIDAENAQQKEKYVKLYNEVNEMLLRSRLEFENYRDSYYEYFQAVPSLKLKKRKDIDCFFEKEFDPKHSCIYVTFHTQHSLHHDLEENGLIKWEN